MGKSTKPTQWFKAVKKAFRSPSKERPPPDQSPGNTGDHGNEKELLTKHDYQPQAHPLPLFEIISHEVVGSEPMIRAQPLPTPETVLLQSPNRKAEKRTLEEEEVEEESIPKTHDHQLDDDDDSAFSEEEKAATRILQRFHSNPLALEGLVRLQALVRGHLVRRQAATTLRTMEAIVRVQAVFRGRRVRMSKDGRAVRSRIISRARRHSSRTNGIVHDGEQLEVEGREAAEQEAASKRKRPTAYLITQQRITPNQSTSFIDCNPNHPQKGWAWLELWTKTRPWDNNTRQGDPESYIEINPNHSHYTTKEVDVSTKVKYYEDYISDLTPKKTNSSSRLVKKEGVDWQKCAHNPLQIEVPETEEDQKVIVPSSSLSEGDVEIVSPQGSDAASVCVRQTPPGIMVDFGGGHEPCEAVAVEQLALPEAHVGSNGADPALSDSLSVSNGVHLQGEDAPSPKGSASDDAANGHASDDTPNGHIDVINGHNVANGHTINSHGDNQPGKEESHITNGEPPASKSRAATCRYMAATQSAKAKFRSSSNPKTRSTPETPESPKRYSSAASRPAKAANQVPKLVTCNSGNSNRRSPSPVVAKEIHSKPMSVDLSPARRNSLRGDGKRWRT